jgi:pilus assembly protein Flp/PilA
LKSVSGSNRWGHWIGRFVRDESGATAIEYGLIVALIFVAIIGAIRTYADNTSTMYVTITSALPG